MVNACVPHKTTYLLFDSSRRASHSIKYLPLISFLFLFEANFKSKDKCFMLLILANSATIASDNNMEFKGVRLLHTFTDAHNGKLRALNNYWLLLRLCGICRMWAFNL